MLYIKHERPGCCSTIPNTNKRVENTMNSAPMVLGKLYQALLATADTVDHCLLTM